MARTSAVSRSGRREETIESKAKESRGRINEFPPPTGGETFTLAKRWSKANILSSCVSSKRERKRERDFLRVGIVVGSRKFYSRNFIRRFLWLGWNNFYRSVYFQDKTKWCKMIIYKKNLELFYDGSRLSTNKFLLLLLIFLLLFKEKLLLL